MNQIPNTIRVRFAPSPTGHLHLGGARTALFNYLFAKKNNGQFLIRIEDTDLERSDAAKTVTIFQSLEWLGLNGSEEPVYQSANRERHLTVVDELLKNGKAYRCFCTADVLNEKKSCAEKSGNGYMYDRTCCHLSNEQIQENLDNHKPFTVRFQVPDGSVEFQDHVRGRVLIHTNEIDDFILQRSDGSPVYQIAVVVDDHDMRITHVIRGDDHLSNTPKQILLYQALGWEVPEFAHIPMILGPDKKRLSKRHGAASVEVYKQEGCLPEAMVNYLALLGWSPGTNQELFEQSDLIAAFDLARVSKSASVFDVDKLAWMNSQYIQKTNTEDIVRLVKPKLFENGLIRKQSKNDYNEFLMKYVDLMKPRAKYLTDFITEATYFFKDPETYEEKAVKKHWLKEQVPERMQSLILKLGGLNRWHESEIEELIRSTAEEWGIGAGKLIHPVRLALTGQASSPGLFEMMALLGSENCMRRLDAALDYLCLIHKKTIQK